MNRLERVIVAEYLVEFPMDKPFIEVMDMVRDDDRSLTVVDVFTDWDDDYLAEHIIQLVKVAKGSSLEQFAQQRPVAIPIEDGRVKIMLDELEFIVDRELANRIARNIDAALLSTC